MRSVGKQDHRQRGFRQHLQIGGGDLEVQYVEAERTDDQTGGGEQALGRELDLAATPDLNGSNP